MKRSQFVAFALALLIFGLGAATGALAHRLYIANGVNASEDWRARYVNEMRGRLKLTTAQVDQLNDILDNTRAKVRAVKDRYKPELLQIKQNQIAEVKGMLNAAQAGEYEKMVSEQEAKGKEQDARDRQVEQQRALERLKRAKGHTAAAAGQ